MKQKVYIGQYAGGEVCGLHVLSVDDETGAIEPVDFIGDIPNTLWLSRASDGSRLFVGRDNGISVFDIGGSRPVKTGDYEIGRSVPCHMSQSSDGQRLYFAEYSDSFCGIIDLSSGEVKSVDLTGSGPNLPRQDKTHAHCSVETPDGRYLCVVDLGTDAVRLYDPVTMEPRGRVDTEPGMGPRHLVFHPNGKLACLVYELGNIITMFGYSGGAFTPINTLSLLPPDFTGHSQAAAVKFSEDGRRVFATNRGHDSVVTFDVDPGSGMLSFVACSPLGGSWPRDFTMLPGERIALACLERAGEVRAFRYDAATGGFTPLDHAYRTHRPVVAVL